MPRKLLLTVLALGGFVACGSGDTPASSADAAGSEDTAASGDAALPDHASGPGKVGLVSVFSAGTTNPSYVVSASFQPMAAHPYECPPVKKVGSCTFARCDKSTSPATHPAAGDITVTGGMTPVTISPGEDGAYPFHTTPGTLFAGGEALNVAASGGEVPAFGGSMSAPTAVTITLPKLPAPADAGPTASINRIDSVPIAWTGASAGVVRVLLSTATYDAMLSCRFDPAAKAGELPAELLVELPAGAALLTYFVDVEREVAAGDWRVLLLAETSAISNSPSGGYNIQLQ